MDNTLLKWGYFIIASTLSKKKEHIQIPYNSNHLLAHPSILSWGGLGSVRECCVPSHPPGLKDHPGPSALAGEAVGRGGFDMGQGNAALGWGWAVCRAEILCVFHLNPLTDWSRGLVCKTPPVIHEASCSVGVE